MSFKSNAALHFLLETSFGELAAQYGLAVRPLESQHAFFSGFELPARVLHCLLHHFFGDAGKTLFEGGAQSLYFLLNDLSKIGGHVDTAQ